MHHITMQAQTRKITAVINDFEQHLDLDTVGVKSVGVTITDSTGGKLTVADNAANVEKLKAYNAAYYAANVAKIKAYNITNAEKIKAKKSQYNAANSEKKKANNAAYNAANVEKIKAYKAAYYAAKAA